MRKPIRPDRQPGGLQAGAPAVEAAGIVKSFGAVRALDGIDLTVAPGTLAALLGPNGAGKTTLVRIISTLARPDAGRLRVLGFDAVRQAASVRARIGLTGQYVGLDDAVTGQDNLILIGRLAGLRRREAAGRAGELAEVFGLADAARRLVRTYSGGMRRRLDLAASLMSSPAVLVLDEPTTGLDPGSREQLWAVLGRLRSGGTSMLLTTQYLEEADRFADVVHVLHRGTVIATGSPAQLKSGVRGAVLEIRIADPATAPTAARLLSRKLRVPESDLRWAPATPGTLTVAAPDGTGTLLAAAAALRSDRIAVADLALRQPTLDEAFLRLVADQSAPAKLAAQQRRPARRSAGITAHRA